MLHVNVAQDAQLVIISETRQLQEAMTTNTASSHCRGKERLRARIML